MPKLQAIEVEPVKKSPMSKKFAVGIGRISIVGRLFYHLAAHEKISKKCGLKRKIF